MAKFRLTPLSKLLVLAVIGAGLFFLGKKYLAPQLTETQEEQIQNNTQIPDNQVKETTNPTPTIKNTTTQQSSFDYTPPLPVNGILKGVVELGASGFNSFIVTIDNQKRWKLEKADWNNSLVYDNMATADDIKTGLKRFIGDMVDYGVLGKNIHFVVSSGAQKVPSTQKIINELRSLKYFVNAVTPEQEGQYALAASLPKPYYENSFMVDIGSGNTKISYIKNGQVSAFESFGAKYYVDNVDANTVSKAIKKVAGNLPASRTKNCFILGGVPFKLAKEVRNGKERYTKLKNPNQYDLDGAKNLAGLNIYKSIQEATHCDTFVFDWEGNFTIGFLLNI